MLNDGMNFLESALLESAVSVTYRKGSASQSLQAVRGGVSWNAIERSNGGALEASARDYIFRRSALPSDPQAKDRITDGTEVWTVFNQLDSECWRRVGDTGLIRVHCKRTGG